MKKPIYPDQILEYSLKREADLNLRGQMYASTMLEKFAANQRSIEAFKFEATAVRRPVFVIGLPRSGTTALFHALAPHFRSPRAWELTESVPPPRVETYETDPRQERAIALDQQFDAQFPGLRHFHYDPPGMPVECGVIFGQVHWSPHFLTMFNLPSYFEWILPRVGRDAVWFHHRRMLQLLQLNHPGRWLLKSPYHLLAMPAIRRLYRDARFVMIHRNPVEAYESMVRFVSHFHSHFTNVVDVTNIKLTWGRIFNQMMEAETSGHDVIHIEADEFRERPGQTVRAILDELT